MIHRVGLSFIPLVPDRQPSRTPAVPVGVSRFDRL